MILKRRTEVKIRKILAIAMSSIFATSLVLFSIGLDSDKGEAEEKDGHKREERGLRKIQHIVYIIKENRTFDNYFGKFPDAEGATSGTISTGKVVPLRQAPDRTPRDIAHSWEAALTAMDGGKMDQFDLIGGGNQNGDFLAYTQYSEARSEERRVGKECIVQRRS